jgi:release factor glutamine methyltransferase
VRVSTAREALEGAVDSLAAAGIPEPRVDAEVLLGQARGRDRARLAAEPGSEIPPREARRFAEMVRRRLRREPVAYILGSKWFRHIELAVDPRVLIPRPETELLVELALELRPGSVLDVGTGSGAVALAIAAELPEADVTATDTSEAALEVARENGRRLCVGDRVRFIEGTVPEGRRFDLVLANLPYVADGEWSALQPEVTRWEPREALLAGPDGLDSIRELLEILGRCLSSSRIPGRAATSAVGAVGLEVGGGQAETVRQLVVEAGFTAVEARRDLAGIERVVWGRS